jgi:hypothetical protein
VRRTGLDRSNFDGINLSCLQDSLMEMACREGQRLVALSSREAQNGKGMFRLDNLFMLHHLNFDASVDVTDAPKKSLLMQATIRQFVDHILSSIFI